MRHSKYLLLICILCGFFGCSTQTFVMMEEYKEKELEAKQLIVAPYSINILDRDKSKEEPGFELSEKTFRNYVDSLFPIMVRIKARISKAAVSSGKSPISLIERILPVSKKDTIKMSLPKDGESISIDSLIPEYILFMDTITVKKIKKHRVIFGSHSLVSPNLSMSDGLPIGRSYELIAEEACFVLWDNVHGKIVSFGHAKVNDVDPKELAGSINQLWEEILKGSPFYKWNKYGY